MFLISVSSRMSINKSLPIWHTFIDRHTKAPHRWQLGSAHIGIAPSIVIWPFSEVSLLRNCIFAMWVPVTLQHGHFSLKFLYLVIHIIFCFFVTIQYLHSYDSQTHEKSASLMGLLTLESRSYAQNSKCFELYWIVTFVQFLYFFVSSSIIH